MNSGEKERRLGRWMNAHNKKQNVVVRATAAAATANSEGRLYAAQVSVSYKTSVFQCVLTSA